MKVLKYGVGMASVNKEFQRLGAATKKAPLKHLPDTCELQSMSELHGG